MGEEINIIIPTRETFQNYPDSSKLDTLFDIGVATLVNQNKQETRIRSLEDQKWFNRGISAGTGVASAIAAFYTALKLKLF